MAVIKHTKSSAQIDSGKLLQFKLDQASSAHIIGLLVSAYAKPQFSGLREILQNALDAAPGKQVKITMPDQANPVLIVRDSGRGLDAKGFVDMIGSVGASDKRDDETKAGCLGIGSLAPMCFAESMTMCSYRDQTMTVAHIYKEDDGRLGYTVADPVACKKHEPDGMEVTVPVPVDMHDALRAGLEVFKFSPAMCKRLIVDGERLEPNHVVIEDSVRVGAHEVRFRVVEGQTGVLQGALILLNSIPMAASFDRFPDLKAFDTYLGYRETYDQRRNPYAGTTLVIDVPPEAGLSFPPSREVIAATRLNAAFLANAVARYFELGGKALAEKGLHVGCEAAVVAKWQASAVERRKSLQDVRDALEKELNEGSKFLRVELSMRHDYRKGAVPLATLHPRLPAELAPRSLETRWYTTKRTYVRTFSMQTAGCVPVDLNKPEAGFKFPWASGDSFLAVVWDRLAEDFSGDWSRVMGKDVRFKRALFELSRLGIAPDRREYDGRRVLLLAAPLPDDHPLAPHSTPIRFEQWLADFETKDDNPFAKAEEADDEDGEQLADGSVLVKGEKVRHPRRFLASSGATDKLGLPKAKPFVYLEICRDVFTPANFAGHPRWDWRYGGNEHDWCRAIEFAETSGLCDGLDVVCLRPAEAANIKRKKERFLDVLKEAAESWYDGLDAAERKWIPLALFRAVVADRTPRMEKLLARFHAEGLGRDGKALESLLHGWDPAPSDKAERFVNAYAKGLKERHQFTNVYDDALDPGHPDAMATAELRRLQAEGVDACGVPLPWLAKPARLLRVWVGSATPLAKLFRLLATLDNERGTHWKLVDHAWLGLDACAMEAAGNPLEESMEAPLEMAKLLAPPP